MKTSVTQMLKYSIVEHIRDDMFTTASNTYVGIGRPIRWGDDNTETASEIEDSVYTTNYRNQVYRDLIAIKKVDQADIALVVPRVDWETGYTYEIYNDHVQLFSHEAKTNLGIGTCDTNDTTIEGDGTTFTSGVAVGDIIEIGAYKKEVIAINVSTDIITVNSNVVTAYTNTSVYVLQNNYPQYANTFYVRNSLDQVFKCLHNANNEPSTIEPTIDIDGQLPENPYIETGDGYKWKFLYTIPYGLKGRFFTKNWMPVIADNEVVAGSEDGRIDIIEILDGGTGYYLDGQSGNSNSLSIVTVAGDGSGASITAKVESGVITDLNILDGGGGYTNAVITITDDYQLASGNTASFDVVIGPPKGHGANPAKELGCYSLMICTTLSGTESDTIPVSSVGSGQDFDFRQIILIRDPLLANGLYANGSVYRTTYKMTVTDPGITNFINDELVSSSNGNAIVVNWDPSTNELDINNVNGNIPVGAQISGGTSAAVATVIDTSEPQISLYSGEVLYIENREKIIRDVDQTEQIRIVLSF